MGGGTHTRLRDLERRLHNDPPSERLEDVLEFTRSVVEIGTARRNKEFVASPMACANIPGSECEGRLEIRLDPAADAVHWRCDRCDRDGSATDYAGTDPDFTEAAQQRRPGAAEATLRIDQLDRLFNDALPDLAGRRMLLASTVDGDTVSLRVTPEGAASVLSAVAQEIAQSRSADDVLSFRGHLEAALSLLDRVPPTE